MFTTHDNTKGAQFDYRNQSESCVASGNYKCLENTIRSVDITGTLTKDGATHTFYANRGESATYNIMGVPASALADVAAEVAAINAEVEAVALVSSDESEEGE